MELAGIGVAASVDRVQGDAERPALSKGSAKQRQRQDWGPPRERSTRRRTSGPSDTPALLQAPAVETLQTESRMDTDAAPSTSEGEPAHHLSGPFLGRRASL